ncbi:MAG: carbohydrate kinase family protein [Patescibacteria group bacterium]
MYNVIAIGDAVLDTHVLIDDASVECNIDGKNCRLCLDYASKIPIADSFQALGGNAANVAVGAAKLGLETAIVSSIGKDGNGKIILDDLKKSGVITDLIYTDEKIKTRYSIVLNFKGERTILSYHQKRQYVWPEAVPKTDWVYYTSLSEGFEPLQEKLINFLNKHESVRLAYNPGSFQLKYSLVSVKEILPQAQILILNLEEAETVLNTTIEKEKSVSALIHKLLLTGAKEVAITDGKNGAWAGDEEDVWYLKSFPVEVISKTGAGDAFSAGYLAARINDHDISTALSWGIANSCSVITSHGSQKTLLDKNGIKKMLTKYSQIKSKTV